jgi:hypothetical protein
LGREEVEVSSRIIMNEDGGYGKEGRKLFQWRGICFEKKLSCGMS